MPPIQFSQLSRRERQIMDILYEHNECSAQQVRERLPDAPSYSAVRALIARLVEKDAVTYRTERGKHIYTPVVAEEKAQVSALNRLIKTFFRGSRLNAVNALLDSGEDKLTDRELDELERTLERVKAVQKNRKKER